MTQKQDNKVIASTYELLCNLLAGKPQTQWDQILLEMHDGDSWAGVNGEKNKSKHAKSYAAFLDSLEIHTLMDFTHNAAERQRYYIQQSVRKPQRATVHQFISPLEVLNGYIKILPTLKNSAKAVATTKKGSVPFGCADLASILLAATPIGWQNKYNLVHSTAPESPFTTTARGPGKY